MKPSNDSLDEETDQTPVTPPELPQFPPGYRFVPTDCELIREYLMKKVENKPIPISGIKDTNLKLHNPTTLTAAFPSIEDNDWYLFTPRDRKYPNGTRPDRAANGGYWKATGCDKEVNDDGKTIGFKKALVFYEGDAQKGRKTGWIMQEYRLNQAPRSKSNPQDMKLDDWVLCRIYETNPKLRGKRKAPEQVSDVDVAVAVATNHEENAVDKALPVMENSPAPPIVLLQEDNNNNNHLEFYHPLPLSVNKTGFGFGWDDQTHPLLPLSVNDNQFKTGFGFGYDDQTHPFPLFVNDMQLKTGFGFGPDDDQESYDLAFENPVVNIDGLFNDMYQNEEAATGTADDEIQNPKWSCTSPRYNTAGAASSSSSCNVERDISH